MRGPLRTKPWNSSGFLCIVVWPALKTVGTFFVLECGVQCTIYLLAQASVHTTVVYKLWEHLEAKQINLGGGRWVEITINFIDRFSLIVNTFSSLSCLIIITIIIFMIWTKATIIVMTMMMMMMGMIRT